MIRRLYFFASLLAVSLPLAIGTLFSIKHEVRLLRDREILLVNEAQTLQEESQVLQAEWAFLSRPERVERLAEQHLNAAPFTPERIWTLQDLASRNPRITSSTAPTNNKQAQQSTIPSFQTISEDTRFAPLEGAN